jgi:AcrR family transcriptional regulator
MGEILEHATRLFAERGYEGTTLQDIAEAIGITRPGLYNYIRSKEELLAALVSDVTESTAVLLRDIRLREDLDPAEKLRTLVRSLALQRAAAPERFRVLDRTEAALPEPVAANHLRARRQALAEIQAIIADGVAGGSFRPCDERVAALSVIGMCNWVAWWFHPGPAHPAEPVAEQLAANAVHMLAAPATADGDDPAGDAAADRAPQRALDAIRRNVDYLEGFVNPR